MLSGRDDHPLRGNALERGAVGDRNLCSDVAYCGARSFRLPVAAIQHGGACQLHVVDKHHTLGSGESHLGLYGAWRRRDDQLVSREVVQPGLQLGVEHLDIDLVGAAKGAVGATPDQ
jgi:hypothetical protein